MTQSSSLSAHYFVDLSADLLRLGHSVRFRANGGSMFPTIKEGDVITVEPIAPSQVRVLDIIFYRADRGVIAHRVVSIGRTEQRGLSNEQEKKNRPDDHSVLSPQPSSLSTQPSALSPQPSSLITSFILRGDASDDSEEAVEPARILGRVVAVERKGRSINLGGRKAKMIHAGYVCAARLRTVVRDRLSAISDQTGLRTEQ